MNRKPPCATCAFKDVWIDCPPCARCIDDDFSEYKEDRKLRLIKRKLFKL